jgi:restriction endonuclease S subunit
MITAKHKGKMYDVEYSIVNVSELEGELRIDAEYYEPFYLRIEEKIKKKNWGFLNNGKFFIKRGTQPEYSKDETNYYALNSVCILDGDIDFSNSRYVSEEFYLNNTDSSFWFKDVLVNSTGVGTLGRVAIIWDKNKKGIVDPHITRIRVIKNNLLLPEYIFQFLRSLYGQFQIERLYHGSSGQIEIYPYDFMLIKIPILSGAIQDQIEKLVLKAYEERGKTENLYKQAENTLLEELGLKDWKPKIKRVVVGGKEYIEEENISIRNLSEAIEADRIDAEYFQPAYDEIITTLKEKVELKPLEKFIPDIQKDIQKGVEVGSDNYIEEGKPFIRVSNLSISGLTDRDQKYISEELYQQLKPTYGPKEGDFLLTKDATLGIAYVVKEPIEGIISSGILKLKINENEIDKEYLALCINSLVGKMQVERDGGGSVIIHWKPEQIKRLSIPILLSETQQKIASLVQQSHESRKKSKELLEVAKKAVEIAIEKNEEEALDYISKNEI